MLTTAIPCFTGTGTSIALAFAEHGCGRIFLADTSSAEGLRTCRDTIKRRYPSVQVHIKEFDGSSEETVDRLFSEVVEALERIDFAVNVVSQGRDGEASVPTGLSVEGYDRNFQVYQRAVCFVCVFLFVFVCALALVQLVEADFIPSRFR